MSKPAVLKEEQPDFSIVLGGPLFQLLRRAHLSGDALELVRRRILAVFCIAWLPLLLLSVLGGHALDRGIEMPFLHDIEGHVRLLIALPILIGTEVYVHLSLRPVVSQFVERGLIVPEDVSRFHAAIDSTTRLRNSVPAELGLLAFVYTGGLWVWWNQIAMGTTSWYAMPDGTEMRLTAAGHWYVFVSVPIFHFILLRWYLRGLLWLRFLWRVSRLNLRLVPTHPDRTGGLGFLVRSTEAFTPILVAQGAMLAGLIASRIFHAGQELKEFKPQAAAFVAFFVVAALVPLLVFTPHLSRAKRRGSGELGRLASRYAGAFEEKWMQGGAPPDDELLGSGDIQSLADLGTSYATVQEMRIVPFGLKDVVRLAVVTAAPLLPLTLTMFSLEEVLEQLIKVIL